MTAFNELKNQYFLPFPNLSFGDCKATALVDGTAYFSRLAEVLNTVGTGTTTTANAEDFIYIAGWWLDLLGLKKGSLGKFALDSPGGSNYLIDLLKVKSQRGVDVRVLGWTYWPLRLPTYSGINMCTEQTIAALRQEVTLANKACLSTISHTAGAVHLKMAIIGTKAWTLAFTGGIDFVEDRHTDDLHTQIRDLPNYWHDIQVQIEGPAVQGIYDFFAQVWNEQLEPSRPVKRFHNVPSVIPGTPRIPPRKLATPVISGSQPASRHWVQSLRTVPVFKYRKFSLMPKNLPISFAPDGLFEIGSAWHKAIRAAKKHIYIEDQMFYSNELMQEINASLQAHKELKVILVEGIGDPNDPAWVKSSIETYRTKALLEGLLPHLDQTHIDRIRVFQRNLMIHAKTTLIDDRWAMIGSANFARRSLYTDIEHAVTIMDEDDRFVKEYRANLWGGHFNLPKSDRSQLDDLDTALYVWNPKWGTPPASGSPITLPPHFAQMPLPPRPIKYSRYLYDRFIDPDSREPWGFP